MVRGEWVRDADGVLWSARGKYAEVGKDRTPPSILSPRRRLTAWLPVGACAFALGVLYWLLYVGLLK